MNFIPLDGANLSEGIIYKVIKNRSGATISKPRATRSFKVGDKVNVTSVTPNQIAIATREGLPHPLGIVGTITGDRVGVGRQFCLDVTTTKLWYGWYQLQIVEPPKEYGFTEKYAKKKAC